MTMSTAIIDIRQARSNDAEAIAEVHFLSWKGAYSGIIPHRSLNAMLGRRQSAWWANAIQNSTQILVAEVDGCVVGYTTLGASRARVLPQQGEIYELYIRPEYQGIGLGSRLLDAARVNLRNMELRGTVIWALEENDLALTFYRGAGGQDVAEGVECFDCKVLRKVAFVWN